jgi:hypothetical protein
MDKNHLDNDFAKAAELFLTYKEALAQNNNDSLLEQTKDKIVIQFWRIIQKTKSITDEMKEHSDLIIKRVINCLSKYSDKAPEEFCKLTYSSIINRLKGNADTESFESKSGMHISNPEDRKRKRIEKAYKQFRTFQSDDKEDFIEYAISFLGFEREDLEEYLFPKRVISLFAKSNSSDEFFLADIFMDLTKSGDSADSLAYMEQLQEQFKIIDNLWLKQKEDARPILSELFTRELLSDFKKNKVFDTVIEILKRPEFICKQMVESFFNDINFKLPTQQEIGEKYGITKSAASVKLKRFIEKLREL